MIFHYGNKQLVMDQAWNYTHNLFIGQCVYLYVCVTLNIYNPYSTTSLLPSFRYRLTVYNIFQLECNCSTAPFIYQLRIFP